MTTYILGNASSSQRELFDVEKLTRTIKPLCVGLNAKYVDPEAFMLRVVDTLPPQLTLKELFDYVSDLAAGLKAEHPDWGMLAGRLAMSYIHHITDSRYVNVCKRMTEFVHPERKRATPLMKRIIYEFVCQHEQRIQEALGDYASDYTYDYFAVRTMEDMYLVHANGELLERPQHFLMRVACHLNCGDGGCVPDIDGAIETYHLLRQKFYTHATPTNAQAGLEHANLSSCFLLSFTPESDSILGIYDKLKECAIISAKGGGIGVSVSDIRATGSYIAGSNAESNGLVPMLRNFNTTAKYVDQGGNRRPGAFAVYLEPWHRDIVEFLHLKRTIGQDELRARDLFYGLWIPDLFMRRVQEDGEWCLLCPKECPGLTTSWGPAFDRLYTEYEKQVPAGSKYRIPARKLWKIMLDSQIETGSYYMLYKDACNAKSNQQHLGCIKNSNLCVEVVQYSDDEETACCNLASVALWSYVRADGTFDYEHLFRVVKRIVINLNKVINITAYYEVDSRGTSPARRSNMRHRPLGIGIQGYATALIRMRLAYDSQEAYWFNDHVFETMYYAALEASCELAQQFGPHESFPGSPLSQNKFQFDLWNQLPGSEGSDDLAWRGRYDWNALRAKIRAHGTYNSLLLAPMPTASTAQILGSSECFEPNSSNMYTRKTKCGEFLCTTEDLVKDLDELGLWTETMKHKLQAHNGSVQHISDIPAELRSLYKTSWDLSQRVILRQAADRGKYIDQSMSMSLHVAVPDHDKLTSMHFYAWSLGLKTGIYYLRSKPPNFARKYTVPPEIVAQALRDNGTAVHDDQVRQLQELRLQKQQARKAAEDANKNDEQSVEAEPVCYLAGGGCCGA